MKIKIEKSQMKNRKFSNEKQKNRNILNENKKINQINHENVEKAAVKVLQFERSRLHHVATEKLIEKLERNENSNDLKFDRLFVILSQNF